MITFNKCLLGLSVVFALAALCPTTSASAQQCQLHHPPDPCEIIRQPFFGTGTLGAWTGCSRRLRLDINEKEFKGGCPDCPGGVCLGCFGTAIRDNGIGGWNAAHASAFQGMFGGHGWIF